MSETLNLASVDYTEDKTLTATCKRLLQQQSFTTQNELREALVDIGFEGISQSTVSRLLSQLGVVKVQNACGKRCIALPLKPHLCVLSHRFPRRLNSLPIIRRWWWLKLTQAVPSLSHDWSTSTHTPKSSVQ